MTAAKKERRIQAVKLADALNAIEGVPVSNYARTLAARWHRGAGPPAQMKSALLAAHRKMAEKERSVRV